MQKLVCLGILLIFPFQGKLFNWRNNCCPTPAISQDQPKPDNRPEKTVITKNGRFQYFQGKDKQWHWHLRAGNGEIICQGEGYKNKADCLHGIDVVKKLAEEAPVSETNAPKGVKSAMWQCPSCHQSYPDWQVHTLPNYYTCPNCGNREFTP